MTSRVQIFVLLGTMAAIVGCTATSHTGTVPSRDRTETMARLPLGHNAGEDPARLLPHGTEVASGRVRMISGGNMHLILSRDAVVKRTSSGIVVVSHGRTRTFPLDSVITEGGSYHEYTTSRK